MWATQNTRTRPATVTCSSWFSKGRPRKVRIEQTLLRRVVREPQARWVKLCRYHDSL